MRLCQNVFFAAISSPLYTFSQLYRYARFSPISRIILNPFSLLCIPSERFIKTSCYQAKSQHNIFLISYLCPNRRMHCVEINYSGYFCFKPFFYKLICHFIPSIFVSLILSTFISVFSISISPSVYASILGLLKLTSFTFLSDEQV